MKNIAQYIDHTLLAANATVNDIKQLCAEAAEHHFASVCVNTGYVPLASECLKNSDVMVCCVVGFPLGACLTEAKAFEAAEAVRRGANEVDMVINVGMLKSGDLEFVRQDIAAVLAACGEATLKVILETCLLTDDEITQVCEICRTLNVGFVKTSTGFSTMGATEHHVALMRKVVGDKIGVKASGGVRDRETAEKMIKAGANRVGASASVAIVSGNSVASNGY
ncbi:MULTISPECIES: deoxyribose-phosphate aldolase [Providencia]|uniref:Deoxyribose-phosphate aldolase n=1 Tax=Providencia stuartii ATCC 25827 TaxID=471874 RepID=A0AA86YWB3_PROST|nr:MULTISPECIES: deoxyribose-phosphate aldolase [Providencia]AMG68155.1 deoxyribose-phosphate aldolase [Providencia stuartii]AVE41219.1 deoxyribose-phosphate aldolase [Providencia stuartii]EDU58059.1 deoxyribose-phosphate aldolase [Providencia stuartii ATCC 25827]EMF0919154.1 deoxyribose-phosphate aldolase [Providencia stuartii]MBN5556671.1 deoxyribose-phosphate aldolase [Providencia stuartii]